MSEIVGTWISHGNVVNPGYGVTGSLMELANIQDWMYSGLEREVDESDESGEAARTTPTPMMMKKTKK